MFILSIIELYLFYYTCQVSEPYLRTHTHTHTHIHTYRHFLETRFSDSGTSKTSRKLKISNLKIFTVTKLSLRESKKPFCTIYWRQKKNLSRHLICIDLHGNLFGYWERRCEVTVKIAKRYMHINGSYGHFYLEKLFFFRKIEISQKSEKTNLLWFDHIQN